MFIVLTESAPPNGSFRALLAESLGFIFFEKIDTKKVLDVKKHDGYEIRKEIWDMGFVSEDGTEKSNDVEMTSAYALDGSYIGNPSDAKRLCDKRGIVPQRIDPSRSVASIGKSTKDDKWYGWSHRAIYGFEVGDEVKKGDCAAEYLPVGFKAKTEADAKKMAIAFARSVS